MKIRIRNFQSIADARLDVQGFTSVTGRTNIGKSALVRAINAMLFGRAGDHFVKRGEEFAGGFIQIDEDPPLKIVWRKVPTDKKRPGLQSALEINGVIHTKTASPAQHKQLTQDHGILELDTGTRRLRPQTATQPEPAFLVDESEGTAAEILKLLGRADVVNNAQQMARKDRRNAEQRKQLRLEDERTATEARDQLKDVPVLQAEWLTTHQQILRAEVENKQREFLQIALSQLKTLDPTPLPTAPKRIEDRTIPVRMLLQQLKGIIKWEQETNTEKKRVLTDLAAVDIKIKELLNSMDKCPTCGKPIHDHENHLP